MESLTKKQSQIIHCKVRCFERYKVEVDERFINILTYAIENGHADFISQTRTGNTVWAKSAYGKIYFMVYDPYTRCICTFLPPDNYQARDYYSKMDNYPRPYLDYDSFLGEQAILISNFRKGKTGEVIDPRPGKHTEIWKVEYGEKLYHLTLNKVNRSVIKIEEI